MCGKSTMPAYPNLLKIRIKQKNQANLERKKSEFLVVLVIMLSY